MEYLVYIPYLIAGFGILMLGLLPGVWRKRRRFLRDSVVVEGTVVSTEVRRGSGSDSTPSDWPIIHFPDGQGGIVESSQAGYGSDKNCWFIGRKVPVRWIPGKPDTAKMDNPWLINMPLFAVLIFSVGFIVLGGTVVTLQLLGVFDW